MKDKQIKSKRCACEAGRPAECHKHANAPTYEQVVAVSGNR